MIYLRGQDENVIPLLFGIVLEKRREKLKRKIRKTYNGKETEIIPKIPSGLTADVRLNNAGNLSVNGLSVGGSLLRG